MKLQGKPMVRAAVMAALIAVMTAFIKLYTGINNGYLHFGDAMIYLTACLLPRPYAMAAAAVGGGLADCLAGVPMWAIPTAIIKALNTLPFTSRGPSILCRRNGVMGVGSGVITVLGYLAAESLLYSPAAAVLSVPFSLVQAGGSAVLFLLAAFAMDRMHLKPRLLKGD